MSMIDKNAPESSKECNQNGEVSNEIDDDGLNSSKRNTAGECQGDEAKKDDGNETEPSTADSAIYQVRSKEEEDGKMENAAIDGTAVLSQGRKRTFAESALADASGSNDRPAGPANTAETVSKTPSAAKKPTFTVKKPAAGGLSSLVGALKGAKKKPTLLEKSKQDWRQFVQQEEIEEELTTHLRSRDAYLDRQEFLLRADYSQFEKERDLRAQERKTQPGAQKKLN